MGMVPWPDAMVLDGMGAFGSSLYESAKETSRTPRKLRKGRFNFHQGRLASITTIPCKDSTELRQRESLHSEHTRNAKREEALQGELLLDGVQ